MSNLSYHALNFWHPSPVVSNSLVFPSDSMLPVLRLVPAGRLNPVLPPEHLAAPSLAVWLMKHLLLTDNKKLAYFLHALEHGQSLYLRSLLSCSPQSTSKACPLSVWLPFWPYFSLPRPGEDKESLWRRKADSTSTAPTMCPHQQTGRCCPPLRTSPLLSPLIMSQTPPIPPGSAGIIFPEGCCFQLCMEPEVLEPRTSHSTASTAALQCPGLRASFCRHQTKVTLPSSPLRFLLLSLEHDLGHGILL